MSKFAERLKKLREQRSLNQADLAAVLNITTSALGMYEQGQREPNLDRVQQLAEYFGVSIDYLVGRTNDVSKTFSPMTRDLLDLLHLPDEQIIEMRAAEIDGRPVTKQEFKQFIAHVRVIRQLDEQKPPDKE